MRRPARSESFTEPLVFAGRVVNPRLCELQLEGCAIFGFGQALFEEMVYDERGQLLNQNLGDYNIPSFDDIPWKLSPMGLEHRRSDELHGIGETLLPPVMAAIGNAVYNAVGARIRDLPMSAEKVLRELGDVSVSPCFLNRFLSNLLNRDSRTSFAARRTETGQTISKIRSRTWMIARSMIPLLQGIEVIEENMKQIVKFKVNGIEEEKAVAYPSHLARSAARRLQTLWRARRLWHRHVRRLHGAFGRPADKLMSPARAAGRRKGDPDH